MTGLDLSRAYYEEYGIPMLELFPDVLPYIAIGLAGSGSECLGLDDEVSIDHDFEPGFCLFLPDEALVTRREAFQLERAYAKLPKEFSGYSRARISPVGGNRHGVIRMEDFLVEKTGTPDGILNTEQWLSIPEQSMLEVTGGEIYRDDAGIFTAVRENLSQMPEDIRLKKLAGSLLIMAQSGQYNYSRCLRHGEPGSAQLSVGEFVRAAIHTVFLLNGRYMPYYKWQFRLLRKLPLLSGLEEDFLYLLTTQNTPEYAENKQMCIEKVAAEVIEVLQDQDLSQAVCGDLEKHAYSVNDRISDASLRNLHILAGV